MLVNSENKIDNLEEICVYLQSNLNLKEREVKNMRRLKNNGTLNLKHTNRMITSVASAGNF